jgi:hypothetical protein
MRLIAKAFPTDMAKIDARLRKMTSIGYDGLVLDGEDYLALFKPNATNQDMATVEKYWRDLTEQIYNAPTAEEQTAYLSKIFNEARSYGQALIAQFALENIAMGITGASKTRVVADYCYKVQYYLDTGSLYAAVEEIQERIEDCPEELAPFVTPERLTTYLNKLKTFLQIP